MKRYLNERTGLCTMMIAFYLVVLVFANTVPIVLGHLSTRFCVSPQYLEVGKVGTIDCGSPEEFFEVLWYDSSDYVNNLPILALYNSGKTGPGYDSGEFDVYPNGTLIINHVLRKHDGIFTVAYILSHQDGPVFNEVRVVIIGNQSVPTVSPPTRLCNSPQFLELGKPGVIKCEFEEDFFAVVWYNSSDYVNNLPILDLRHSGKTGAGYVSGEFDAYPNGSLIISNVLIKHEGMFTVAYLLSQEEGPAVTEVRVIVIVKPDISFPQIHNCGNKSPTCYSEVESPITCSVQDVRPEVNLTWIARTFYGDKTINDHLTIYRGNVTYTSQVTTKDAFRFSKRLVLLVCKLHSPPGMTLTSESTILAQNRAIDILPANTTHKYFERHSKMKLSCTNTVIGYLVWKKVYLGKEFQSEVLLYSFLIGEDHTEILVDNMTVDVNGSLVVPEVHVKHEGTYICIFGDGLRDGWKAYEVTVTVSPVPPYPVIEGCNHQEYCELEVEYIGNLTCTVKRVRPVIHLEWVTVYDHDAGLISFENKSLAVTENGETYDVSLTVTYNVTETSLDRLTIMCKVQNPDQTFHSAKRVEFFLKGNVSQTEQNDIQGTAFQFFPFFTLITAAIIYYGWILSRRIRQKIRMYREHYSRKTPADEDITTRLLEQCEINKNRDEFVKQLKERYTRLYQRARPMAYFQDRLQCTGKVFVQGGFKFLNIAEGKAEHGEWKKISTYEDIFRDPEVKSTRQIVEGEPGYGKSTIALQFAHDWCNPKQSSPLKSVEILVLLRLRQLRRETTVYEAIKMLTLPSDTSLSEETIKSVLCNSQSVVIIFEGFDEYLKNGSRTCPDVMKIISEEMFPNFHVIITTTPSFIPENCPTFTKRLKLTGFNEKARGDYIEKAVVSKDVDEHTIKTYLRENSILSDLCQVPLLFVMFVHMVNDSAEFRKFNSLTKFFNCMISSIYCHMRSKCGNENDPHTIENQHSDLDKLAFETLKISSGRTIWNKVELLRQLGLALYDISLRIGIFVETEVIDTTDNPISTKNERARCKTEVSFYHKLFCEWYAAHYLSDSIQKNPNLNLSEFLQDLSPFDVQYLYRFACGLDKTSAEKIIPHLTRIEGGDKFVSLCILEQPECDLQIIQEVCQMFSKGVSISSHDSLLLQRSLVELLRVSAENNISVDLVVLQNCIKAVHKCGIDVIINSSLHLTIMMPAKKLHVIMTGKELSNGNVKPMLEYSSKCPSLEYLEFRECILPRLVKAEPLLSTLQEKGVTVLWQPSSRHHRYILNPGTGRWEEQETGKELTKTDFDKMRLEVVGSTSDIEKGCVIWVISVLMFLVFPLSAVFSMGGSSTSYFLSTFSSFITFVLSIFLSLLLGGIVLSVFLIITTFLCSYCTGRRRRNQEDDEEPLIETTDQQRNNVV